MLPPSFCCFSGFATQPSRQPLPRPCAQREHCDPGRSGLHLRPAWIPREVGQGDGAARSNEGSFSRKLNKKWGFFMGNKGFNMVKWEFMGFKMVCRDFMGFLEVDNFELGIRKNDISSELWTCASYSQGMNRKWTFEYFESNWHLGVEHGAGTVWEYIASLMRISATDISIHIYWYVTNIHMFNLTMLHRCHRWSYML